MKPMINFKFYVLNELTLETHKKREKYTYYLSLSTLFRHIGVYLATVAVFCMKKKKVKTIIQLLIF